MASFTAKEISDLNNSMSAMQNVSAGTLMSEMEKSVSNTGVHVVDATDMSASAVVITASACPILGWIVSIMRSGKVATSDAAITASEFELSIADGSTYSLTLADTISYHIIV